MSSTLGNQDGPIDGEAVYAFVQRSLDNVDLDGRSLCLVIPDATRTCPLRLLLGAVENAVIGRVRSCIAVVALGTHAAMSDSAISVMVGKRKFPVVNHQWWSDSTFIPVGRLEASTVSRITNGLLASGVDVRINHLVPESDVTLIIGPVLPHEVVGFSGGNKYLFPGLSNSELIDITHWVGALITSQNIIGQRGPTPVRALIDAAAGLVPGFRLALCAVVDRHGSGLHSLSFGEPEESWAAAADIAAKTHVENLARPVNRVLSIVPTRYSDLWTGAKGFYKVEPIVADGGEVVLYAPHITEVAAMHPGLVELGYHCRDYFLANWDRYRDHPWGELAHSTHLFGEGTYDAVSGERQRVRVTLATGIPPEIVHRVNLHYADPASIDEVSWSADPDSLVLSNTGEVLYRLASESPLGS